MTKRSFTYRSTDVHVILGVLPVTGFVKGAFIEVDYAESAVKLYRGCDGEAARTVPTHSQALVRLRLMSNSFSNKILTGLLTLDRATGAGVLPFAITDSSVGTLHACFGIWPIEPPRSIFAGKATGFEWLLQTDNMNSVYAVTAGIL